MVQRGSETMQGTKDTPLPTRLLATMAGLTSAAFIVCKTGRDALFFQEQALLQLPLAYLGIGLASLPASFLFVQAMKTWGSRPARVGLLILVSCTLSAFLPFLEVGNYPVLIALFLLIPTLFGLLFASIWLLASEIYEKKSKGLVARAFGTIGASSLAGGIGGGLVAKGLASQVAEKQLLLLAAVVLLAVAALALRTHHRFPAPAAVRKDRTLNGNPALAIVFRESYARTLLWISMAGALAALLIDFQFYSTVAAAKLGPVGNAHFFANFYTLLNLSALSLQLFLAPRIQDRVGLRGGLVILPLSLLGGATFATAAATAMSRSVLKVTEAGLKSSIHRSVWEQAFIPVNPEVRSFVKIVVDGIGPRVAEIFGSLLILTWLLNLDPAEEAASLLSFAVSTGWISWATLAVTALWLWLTHKIRLSREDEVLQTTAQEREQDAICVRFPDQCACTTEMGKGLP